MTNIGIKDSKSTKEYNSNKSSTNGIDTYELPSLGYEVTDHHLPRGFVTSKKPSISVLCDSIHCDRTHDLYNGNVLACGHCYHNHFL